MTTLDGVEHEVATFLRAEGIALPSKAEAEREAGEIALTWALTFGATFATLARPALDAANFGTAKAVIISSAIAGAAAGGRAAKPLIVKTFRGLKPAKTTPETPAQAPAA